jgi:hypothetical protein
MKRQDFKTQDARETTAGMKRYPENPGGDLIMGE